MQSKTSFFNPAVFKSNIMRSLALFIPYTLILFFTGPFPFITAWFDTQATLNRQEFLYSMQMENTTLIAAVYMICIVLAVFFYLYSPRSATMFHAYPISRKCLFWTNISSVVVMSLMPILISALIATGMTCFLPGGSFRALQPLLWAIWYWALSMSGYTFVFLGIAAFTAMVSGQLITNLVFYVIFNFLFVGIECVIRVLAGTLSFGLAYLDTTPKNLIFLCPVIYLSRLNALWRLYEDMDVFPNSTGDVLLILGIYVLCCTVLLFAAYAMYLRKKTESAGDFITLPILKPVFAIGASFFISVMLSTLLVYTLMDWGTGQPALIYAVAILSCLLLGAAVYFICLMLIQKDLHVFTRKHLTYFGVYAAASTAVLLLLFTDALGFERRLPDADDVVYAGVSANDILVMTEQDDIAELLSMHREIIAHKSDLLSAQFDHSALFILRIRYKLKNGRSVTRSYYLNEPAEESERYQKFYGELMEYFNQPEKIKQALFSDRYAQAIPLSMSAPDFSDEEDEDTAYAEIAYGAAEAAKLYDALLQDIDEGKYLILPADMDYRRSYYISLNLQFAEAGFTADMLWSKMEDFTPGGEQASYLPPDTLDVYLQVDENCTHTVAALKEISSSAD